MSTVPYTVGALREALEELDDDVIVMVPGTGDNVYDYEYLRSVNDCPSLEFPDEEDEDGNPPRRHVVVLERE